MSTDDTTPADTVKSPDPERLRHTLDQAPAPARASIEDEHRRGGPEFFPTVEWIKFITEIAKHEIPFVDGFQGIGALRQALERAARDPYRRVAPEHLAVAFVEAGFEVDFDDERNFEVANVPCAQLARDILAWAREGHDRGFHFPSQPLPTTSPLISPRQQRPLPISPPSTADGARPATKARVAEIAESPTSSLVRVLAAQTGRTEAPSAAPASSDDLLARLRKMGAVGTAGI